MSDPSSPAAPTVVRTRKAPPPPPSPSTSSSTVTATPDTAALEKLSLSSSSSASGGGGAVLPTSSPSLPSKSNKPTVLILGGIGFIGRNFLKYLIDNKISDEITVADKTLPAMARMLPRLEEYYSMPEVKAIQADLTKDAHLDRVFPPGKSYDYVINLAAETRLALDEKVYESRCRDLSIACAKRAKASGVKRFVEVSTALVYKSQCKVPAKEEAPVDPCTAQARNKLIAEQEILKLSQDRTGFDAVIVRPAFVYGPEDWNGLMPRMACAAAYVELEETMKFLWDAGTKLNTVHVRDVVKALWHVATSKAVTSGTVWNLCDKSDTDQGRVNDILGPMFGIKTGFHGTMISSVARLRLQDVVNAANEKHLTPWDDVCREHDIIGSPISPFISHELLNCIDVYIDGTAIERTGFSYDFPTVTPQLIRESVENAIASENFPPIIDNEGK